MARTFEGKIRKIIFFKRGVFKRSLVWLRNFHIVMVHLTQRNNWIIKIVKLDSFNLAATELCHNTRYDYWSLIKINFQITSTTTVMYWVNTLWPSDAIFRHIIWVNIVPANGLLCNGTKPLPGPVLTYHRWSFLAFTCGQFYNRCFNCLSLKCVWKSLI